MASWLQEQWKQIRGNPRYDLLVRPLIVIAGAGLIGSFGALLSRIFAGVAGEWLEAIS